MYNGIELGPNCYTPCDQFSKCQYKAGEGISIEDGVISSTILLDNYYTKSEVDNAISSSSSSVDLSNYYTKSEVDSKIAKSYTKEDWTGTGKYITVTYAKNGTDKNAQYVLTVSGYFVPSSILIISNQITEACRIELHGVNGPMKLYCGTICYTVQTTSNDFTVTKIEILFEDIILTCNNPTDSSRTWEFTGNYGILYNLPWLFTVDYNISGFNDSITTEYNLSLLNSSEFTQYLNKHVTALTQLNAVDHQCCVRYTKNNDGILFNTLYKDGSINTMLSGTMYPVKIKVVKYLYNLILYHIWIELPFNLDANTIVYKTYYKHNDNTNFVEL